MRSTSRRSTCAHSDGRSPVAAANVIAAAPRVSSSAESAFSSEGVKTRTVRGGVGGFLPDELRGVLSSCSRSERLPRRSAGTPT